MSKKILTVTGRLLAALLTPLCLASGLAMTFYGFRLWFEPLAFIVVGGFLVWIGIPQSSGDKQ